MLAATIGLAGALIFGGADFLGGLASKRISSLRVTAVAAVAGLIALVLAYPLVGGVWSADALLWGGLSGVSGAIAISLLYGCLAIGPMSILSPLTAVVSAVVPLTAGLLGGTAVQPIGYLGLALALVAVLLVGFVPERGAVRPSLGGILMAIGSGTAIGVFLILIDLTPQDSGLVPLIINRGVNAAIMSATILVLLLVSRGRPDRADAPGPDDATLAARRTSLRTAVILAVCCGIVDAAANALVLLGLRLGELTVISVLTAMYPAGTIVLAAVVLRERIAPVQIGGLVLAVVAAGLLAIA